MSFSLLLQVFELFYYNICVMGLVSERSFLIWWSSLSMTDEALGYAQPKMKTNALNGLSWINCEEGKQNWD